MLRYPRNYEEAKIIIKNSVEEKEMRENYNSFNKKRALFISCLSFGAVLAASIVTKQTDI